MPSNSAIGDFPPSSDSLVTLANWQEAPHNRWAFQHLRELIPTHRIARGSGPSSKLEVRDLAEQIDRISVHRLVGGPATVAEVLVETFTDAVLILHEGELVFERYFGQMRPDSPHLLMSVSKSLVGCVAGVLVADGRLDLAKLAEDYVPEVRGSGYGRATVRDILDMRTGVKFSEKYSDLDAEVRVMEVHVGWRPACGEPAMGVYGYLTSLGSEGPHGGPFKYRSADTDMLGWICERATGMRMAELISTYIWGPMGAEFDAELTCDPMGSAVHDGGVSACARDLVRFGRLLLDDGRNGPMTVIPEYWLRAARTVDSDIQGAFSASTSAALLPGGWYRSKFWFIPGTTSGVVQMCRGIHGQMVWVDRETRTVGVKLSSWPEPENTPHFIDTMRVFNAVSRHLAGITSSHRKRK